MEPTTPVKPEVIITQSPLPKNKLIIFGILISLAITLFSLYYFKIINFGKITKPQTTQPAPALTSGSNNFSQIAKTDLPNYLNTSLKTTLASGSFEIRQTNDKNGAVLDPQRFTTSWNGSNGELYNSTIRYNSGSQTEDQNILIILPQTTSLTLSSAPTLINQYIKIKPESVWKCGTIQQSAICENFWEDGNKIKHGIGAISPLPNSQKASVFACDIYPNSPTYGWKSCNSYKSQTGL